MSGFNKVMLLGNIVSEPEVYVTRSGRVVLSIRLATDETYLDENEMKRERTSYHAVVLFGKLADKLSMILHRGHRVFVDGALRTSTYEGRDGRKWTKTEVVANDVLYAGESQDTPVRQHEDWP